MEFEAKDLHEAKRIFMAILATELDNLRRDWEWLFGMLKQDIWMKHRRGFRK